MSGSGSGSGRIIIRGRRGAHAGDGAGAGRGVNVCGSAGVQWLMTCDCQQWHTLCSTVQSQSVRSV